MVRKQLFLSLIFLFICLAVVNGQTNKYWVFLKDKKNVSFDPYSYFDRKTIERRIANNIPLIDSTDFPLNQQYFATIKNIVDSISHPSRWFNAMSVYATESEIQDISNLYFVKSVEKMEGTFFPAEYMNNDWDTTLNSNLLNVLEKQTIRMGGDLFEKSGIDGKGIRIAIFDGGFPTVNTSPVFEQIRKDGRIIKTWDFAKNKEFVYDFISHGTMVMSCIGGIINGKKIGLATGAEFLLARTEVRSEPFSEEENWLAAVEWADKNGADIINSSLGYTYHRYFQSQMDGKTSLVVKAANLAAKKGILVVNAAGNDGDNSWHIIGTPADADSVLAIGGIDPFSDYHISFSSYGPTCDKRLKPNVCAFGSVTAAGKKGPVSTQGTSFASPLVAGFAACAWQTNRTLSNMQMFSEIEESADLYPYFDYAHGYGVPQAFYFLKLANYQLEKNDTIIHSFDFVKSNDTIRVIVSTEFFNMRYTGSQSYLYYNIQNSDGTLKEYSVLSVSDNDVLNLSISDFKKGQKLNVHLGNYTNTFEF